MIDVVVDERSLCFADGLLDGMQLLRKIEARPPLIKHRNHPAKMTLGPP
jgi:hypothetical protein